MAIRINSDFKDIVRVLSAARVRYLVVGGVAVIEHTEPRYTKDLDLWVEPSPENAGRVMKALAQFGAPLAGVTAADFTNEQMVYQMGVEPVRIDILMGLEGVRFERAWVDRKMVKWGRTSVPIMSAAHLIANKRRVGRPQDLADVARLKALSPVRAKKRSR